MDCRCHGYQMWDCHLLSRRQTPARWQPSTGLLQCLFRLCSEMQFFTQSWLIAYRKLPDLSRHSFPGLCCGIGHGLKMPHCFAAGDASLACLLEACKEHPHICLRNDLLPVWPFEHGGRSLRWVRSPEVEVPRAYAVHPILLPEGAQMPQKLILPSFLPSF